VRLEVLDPLGASARRQPLQELGSKPTPLPPVDDRDRRYGTRRVAPVADVARDARPLAAPGVKRDDRLMGAVVNLSQLFRLCVGQSGRSNRKRR
jgi:hypothetical protein